MSMILFGVLSVAALRQIDRMGGVRYSGSNRQGQVEGRLNHHRQARAYRRDQAVLRYTGARG